ncbi:MAG: hypothetical protein AAGF51_14610 [Pseudomonadota bacterium]
MTEFTLEDASGVPHTYRVACPLDAFDQIAKMQPRLRIALDDLRSGACDYALALHIGKLGLRYGNGGATIDDFYQRHGWMELQRLALETLIAGLPPAGKDDAAGNEKAETETATS